jgi:hypothetical protein
MIHLHPEDLFLIRLSLMALVWLRLFDITCKRQSTPTLREKVLTGASVSREADAFMNKLQTSAAYIRRVTTKYSSSDEPYQWRSQKIRIAVLDTGIDIEEDSFIKGAEDRIKERCSFLDDLHPSLNPLDCQDVHGHGTHVTRLILRAASPADIFVAKISNGVTIAPQHLHRIARVSNNAAKTRKGMKMG